jgi:phage protein D
MQPYYAPDFLVKIAGLTLEADVTNAVIDLTYDNNIETADMFTLRLNNANLRFTDSALFDVGKNVEVYMGYVGDLHPMMLGEITAVSPSFPQSGAPTITVTGYDKSHRLRHNTPSRFTFQYLNDSLIAAQIAAENLLIPVIDPSPMPPRECIQQTGSDWTFLKELAERNFFQVYVHWDKLYFRFPRPQTEATVLEWGKSLISFSPRLSTSGQFGIQEIRGYDTELAQKIVAILPAIALGSDLDNLIERLGSGYIEQLASLGRHVVRKQPVGNYLEATQLAKSMLMQLLEGLYQASGSCIGIPTLRAGEMVEIRGVGKRFGGKYTLSKVTHTINQSGYQTQFEVSQKYHTNLLQSLRKDIAESPSPNQQERIGGVVIGTVVSNIDPKGSGKVLLSFPHLSDVNLKWARVANPTALGNKDTFFSLDRDDQVLVVFEQGSINRPIVIGQLSSAIDRAPAMALLGNEKKVIQTKTGMKIVLDETPAREKLVLQDKAGSTITMDSLTGDIIIEAKGNVKIKSGADGKVQLNPP